MIIHQQYKAVKAGTLSKEQFIKEAREDKVLTKYITNFDTFEDVISNFKRRGLLFEGEETAPKKFDMQTWMKESLTDEINEPKGTVHDEHTSFFEFEKGWRYELKAIGKFEDEDVQKAKAKAVKNLEKDPIHYTRIEMGEHAPEEKGHKMLDISKGENKIDKDNQPVEVKVKDKDPDSIAKEYLKQSEEKGKTPKKLNEAALNEKEAEPTYPSRFQSEDENTFVIDLVSGKIVKGFKDPGEAVDYADGLNKGVKPSTAQGKENGYLPFSKKELAKKGMNFRAVDNWEKDGDDKPAEKSWLDKLRGFFNEGPLSTMVSSHQNDKSPLAEDECACNKLPGGKGDNTSAADVDQKELSLGLSIEAEHTDDPEIAKEIALDHLTEDPQYYSKMIAAGLEEAANTKLPTKTDWPFYVVQNQKKLIAGYPNRSEAVDFAAENPQKGLKVVSREDLPKMAAAFNTKRADDWANISVNNFMWKGVDEAKLEQLKEAIRVVVRKQLLKEYVHVPSPAGPDVDRQELKRELKGIDWPKVGEPDDNTQSGYRDRIQSQGKDNIKSIIDRMGQEGIDLYNEYAPEGCKWGQENDLFSVKEEDSNQVHQDIKDMVDLDPKDLAKEVLAGQYDNTDSIKSTAAARILGHAVKDGEKDPSVIQAFHKLSDKLLNKK